MGWLDRAFLCSLHLLLGLTGWAYFSSMFVHPGKPPDFWVVSAEQGFYLENPDERKRAYCMACHIFKPERCHHCSSCGRCVLNMDHHCPWLNNCVGFFNRKHFFLTIVYALLLLVLVAAEQLRLGVVLLQRLGTGLPQCSAYNCAVFVVSCVLVWGLLVPLGDFVWYHYSLICMNSTTLEQMENERSGHVALARSGVKSSVYHLTTYDQGKPLNWAQVMGKKKALWPLPHIGSFWRPHGDGVVFPKRDSQRDLSISEDLAPSKAGNPLSLSSNLPQERDNRHSPAGGTGPALHKSAKKEALGPASPPRPPVRLGGVGPARGPPIPFRPADVAAPSEHKTQLETHLLSPAVGFGAGVALKNPFD